MIPESGHRLLAKIMLNQNDKRDPTQQDQPYALATETRAL